MYCKTTIYVSFSSYVYIFAKIKLKLILFLYVTFMYSKFIPQPPIKCSTFVPASDISCPLCKIANDSFQHLFFGCIFARVVWCHSFWPLDSTVFNFSFMLDWIKLIISPTNTLGIPLVDCHKFQIFVYMACDILWYYRNQTFHNGTIF
jgi:hypothetical protein